MYSSTYDKTNDIIVSQNFLKMRKLLVLTLLSNILFHQSIKAQYYFYNEKFYDKPVVFDLGPTFGVMNALTDLGKLDWKSVKPSAGFYILAMFHEKIGLRLETTFGEVSGADSLLKSTATKSGSRYENNLSFKSKIADFQLAAEIHPLMFRDYNELSPPRLSPYGVIGFGYYSFNPQANLNGQWYSLQPLRTEGQGFKEYPTHKPYQLSQFNITGGMGVKYEISSQFTARLEANYRYLFTDYLDDVSTTFIDPTLFNNYLPANLASLATQLYSRKGELKPNGVTNPGDQRGGEKTNDSFFTIQLKVGIVIGRIRRY